MNSDIVVALLALIGTIAGSLGGIVVSGKLTAFRLEQLERRVQEHNNFAQRIPSAETRLDKLEANAVAWDGMTRKMPVVEEQIKVVNHRLDDLERSE